MSHYAKLMLWAAVGLVLAYSGFFLLMTDGLALGARSPLFMGLTVLGYLAAVLTVIVVQQWLCRPAPDFFPDEREEVLEARAEQLNARVLETGVFAIIGLAIYEAAAGPQSLGSYSLTRPEAMVFAMITIASAAGIARMILAVMQDMRA